MLGALYVGLAGMQAYSKGLDVISNNVANLNTTGFKAGVASFSDVVYHERGGAIPGSSGNSQSGAGVHVDGERQSFRQGDLRDTNNPLDAAMQGTGFFVLERDGQTYYTRAGSFEFDKDGVLVERQSRARVMMTRDGGMPGELRIDAFRTFAPRATSDVNLRGALARTGTGTETAQLSSLVVHDTTGARHTLRLRLTRATDNPLLWNAEVLSSTDAMLATGQIRFNGDGTPAADNVPIMVTVSPDNLPAFTFSLNAGAAGSYDGLTSLATHTSSSINMARQNGLELGTISPDGVNFDERGNLEITYTNGEKLKIARLVVASVGSDGDLQSLGAGLWVARDGRTPTLLAGMEFGLGRVVGENLELSNVELADQFSDLIIIQRGYQASSQMTSVANEMMQQLLSMQDRR